MQIFLICMLIKQEKHMTTNHFINHTFYETNFKSKWFTADVKYNGTVRLFNSPNKKGHSFSKFEFSLNGGDLVFWFAFKLAVHFRPKLVLALEIPREFYRVLIYYLPVR